MRSTKVTRQRRPSVIKAKRIFKYDIKDAQYSLPSANFGRDKRRSQKRLISYSGTSLGAIRKLQFFSSTRTRASVKFCIRLSQRLVHIRSSSASKERETKWSTGS